QPAFVGFSRLRLVCGPALGLPFGMLGPELIVLGEKRGQLAAVRGVAHHSAPVRYWACPVARIAHAAITSIRSAVASRCYLDLTGVPLMIGSAGAVSSKWMAASLLARNAGTESKPETNEATSMAATVPLGSAVEGMMSVSNFGPATSFNRVACGTAATMTAAL